MPIESYIDEARKRVVARVRGDFTFTDIVETLERNLGDPRWRPGFDVLSDHTEVGEPITPSQARRMVVRLGALSDLLTGSRWAIVTTKLASYSMMKVIALMAEQVPMEIEVFTSLEEAEAWLVSTEGPGGVR